MTDLTCLEAHKKECEGQVELRESLSGTGVPLPRCDKHWEARLEEQERINQTYGSPTPPPDFDPLAAGERWDEE